MLKARFCVAIAVALLAAFFAAEGRAQNNVVVCSPITTGGCLPLPAPVTYSGATVGTAHAQVLAAGQASVYLMLANPSAAGTNTIYCRFDGTNAVVNAAGTVPIAPGQINTWESNAVPLTAIDCISTGASTPLTIGVK